MQRSRVLLPHPLGPTTTMTSPLATVRSTPSTATTAPNRLCSPAISIIGPVRATASQLIRARRPDPG